MGPAPARRRCAPDHVSAATPTARRSTSRSSASRRSRCCATSSSTTSSTPPRSHGSVRFLHLGAEVLERRPGRRAGAHRRRGRATEPELVFVDSFRAALVRKSRRAGRDGAAAASSSGSAAPDELGGDDLPDRRVQRERRATATRCSPSPTASSGCSRAIDRNSVVRKLQVVKMRGQVDDPGAPHRADLRQAGLRVYPRLPNPEPRSARSGRHGRRRHWRRRASTR